MTHKIYKLSSFNVNPFCYRSVGEANSQLIGRSARD